MKNKDRECKMVSWDMCKSENMLRYGKTEKTDNNRSVLNIAADTKARRNECEQADDWKIERKPQNLIKKSNHLEIYVKKTAGKVLFTEMNKCGAKCQLGSTLCPTNVHPVYKPLHLGSLYTGTPNKWSKNQGGKSEKIWEVITR
jgi:hypothetical protein